MITAARNALIEFNLTKVRSICNREMYIWNMPNMHCWSYNPRVTCQISNSFKTDKEKLIHTSKSSIQQSYQGQFYLDHIDDLGVLIEKNDLDVLGLWHFCWLPKTNFKNHHWELLFQPWRSDQIGQGRQSFGASESDVGPRPKIAPLEELAILPHFHPRKMKL